MKKLMELLIAAVFISSYFSGCVSTGDNSARHPGEFNIGREITVVSREDGSGTRGAFIELFGIDLKFGNGNKKDLTTKEAVIANKTDIMLTNISNDVYAIGYVSIGSLNSFIKALYIDGIEPTAANVKNGAYKVSRPFVIATKGEQSVLANDFIGFILSKEGQEVVGRSYITIDDSSPVYSGNSPSGKITVAGSSSVTPIMEKLKETYLKINKNAVVEIQMSDSTSGMNGVIEGTCDIGMASRELKESEKKLLNDTVIALDGIAVIVNPSNPIADITGEQVKSIFTGESIKWNDVIK